MLTCGRSIQPIYTYMKQTAAVLLIASLLWSCSKSTNEQVKTAMDSVASDVKETVGNAVDTIQRKAGTIGDRDSTEGGVQTDGTTNTQTGDTTRRR